MRRHVDWKQLSERRLELNGRLGVWGFEGRMLFSTEVRPGSYVCYAGYQSFLGPQVGRVAFTEQPVETPMQSAALSYTEVHAPHHPCDLLLGDARTYYSLSEDELRTAFKAGVSTNEQAAVCAVSSGTFLVLTSPTASGVRTFLSCLGEYAFTFLDF